MRSSTVLSLPPQLAFPGQSIYFMMSVVSSTATNPGAILRNIFCPEKSFIFASTKFSWKDKTWAKFSIVSMAGFEPSILRFMGQVINHCAIATVYWLHFLHHFLSHSTSGWIRTLNLRILS
jgi:hypothetical protein